VPSWCPGKKSTIDVACTCFGDTRFVSQRFPSCPKASERIGAGHCRAAYPEEGREGPPGRSTGSKYVGRSRQLSSMAPTHGGRGGGEARATIKRPPIKSEFDKKTQCQSHIAQKNGLFRTSSLPDIWAWRVEGRVPRRTPLRACQGKWGAGEVSPEHRRGWDLLLAIQDGERRQGFPFSSP